MGNRLLVAGWKSVSLVDVYGSPSFTLWLCGCNLRCPFCHNWRIAERLECKWVDVDKVFSVLQGAARFVDFFHVTGGEPLLQWEALVQLFGRVKEVGLSVSLNSNCTLVKPLEKLLKKQLVDHLATDLKVPFRVLTGLQEAIADKLWRLYLDCISTAAKHDIVVELRIPVPANIQGYVKELEKALSIVSERLKNTKWYIVVNPLLGPPHTSPRNKTWCKKHCNPSRTILDRVAAVARKYTDKVYVPQTPQDLLDYANNEDTTKATSL